MIIMMLICSVIFYTHTNWWPSLESEKQQDPLVLLVLQLISTMMPFWSLSQMSCPVSFPYFSRRFQEL